MAVPGAVLRGLTGEGPDEVILRLWDRASLAEISSVAGITQRDVALRHGELTMMHVVPQGRGPTVPTGVGQSIITDIGCGFLPAGPKRDACRGVGNILLPPSDEGAPGSPPCILPWRRDPVSGECALFFGEGVGPDPVAGGNGAMGMGVHGAQPHGDTAPVRVSRSVRRCPRGQVLGKGGWCHQRIANRDRMYPKPRRPLGTSGDLNAVTKASAFGRRLVANKKKLKKLQQNLAKASG